MALKPYDGDFEPIAPTASAPKLKPYSGDFDPVPSAAARPKRTLTQAVTDTGRSLASGVGTVVEGMGTLGGLVTGNMDNAVVRTGRSTRDYWQEGQSDQLKFDREQRSDAIDRADGILGKAGTAIKETVTNPALFVDTVAETAASMLPAGAAGRIGAGIAGARALSQGATASQAATRAARVGTAAGIGTGAVQAGADVAGGTYQDAMGVDDAALQANPDYVARVAAGEAPEAVKHDLALQASRAAFGGTLPLSLASQAIPGGATIERAIAGAASRAGSGSGLVARGLNAARGAGGEAMQEAIEEGGGQFVGNLAQRAYVDPNTDLTDGVGEALGLGAVAGGGLGAVAGAVQSPRTLTQPPPNAPAEAPAAEPSPVLALPPPDPITVTPEGVASTAEQTYQQQRADAEFAQGRAARGLTPDVNRARAAHPGAAPTLPDGSPVPDPAAGPLSRAVNVGVTNGAVQQAAAEQAMAAAQAAAEAQAKDAKRAPVTIEGEATRVQPGVDPATGELVGPDREALKTYINAQLDRGSLLPEPRAVADAWGMKPREAGDLIREVRAQRRAAALNPTPEVPDAAAAGGSEPTGTDDAATAALASGGRTDAGAAGEAGTAVAAEGTATQAPPADRPAPDALTTESADRVDTARIYREASIKAYGDRGVPDDAFAERAREIQAAVDAHDADSLIRRNLGDPAAAPAGRAVFEALTGVKLPPGRGATERAIDAWAGVTPEERARRRQDHRDKVAAERAGREAAGARAAAAAVNVQITGTDQQQNGAEFVDGLMAQGFTRAVQRGAHTYLANEEGRGHRLPHKVLAKYARAASSNGGPIAGSAGTGTRPAATDSTQGPSTGLRGSYPELQTGSADAGAASAGVAAAAAEAAASPDNDLPAPTEAQKEAGNYRKGHARIAGLDVSIENPAGSRRRPEWPPLQDHYGYIRGSVGADKDHVDVFLTENAEDASRPVFVVDQVDQNGKFDEHKVVMGAADEAEARAAYLRNYAKGWTGLGGITQMTQEEFKAWVRDPAKTRNPAAARRVAEGQSAAAASPERQADRSAAAGTSPPAEARRPTAEPSARSGPPSPGTPESAPASGQRQAVSGRETPRAGAGRRPSAQTTAEAAAPQTDRAQYGLPRIVRKKDAIAALRREAGMTVKQAEEAFAAIDREHLKEGTRSRAAVVAAIERAKSNRRPTRADEPYMQQGETALDRLTKDKAFRAALRGVGDPHVQSEVAYRAAQGWEDAKAGRPADDRNYIDTSAMTGAQNPVDAYIGAYLAAKGQPPRVVRARESAPLYLQHGPDAASEAADDPAAAEAAPAVDATPQAEAEPALEGAADTVPAGDTAAEASDETESPAAANESAPEQDRIEDFGETLHGARKHLYAESYRDTMTSAMARDPATSTLSQAWPAPDYQKLLDDGTDPWTVAFVRAARDEVPTKPTASWKLKGWVTSVTMLRKFSADLLDGSLSVDRLRELLKQPQYEQVAHHVGGRADLYNEVGHSVSLKGISFAHRHYTLYRGQQNVSMWVVDKRQKATAFSNWPQELATGKTREEAIEAFRKKVAEIAAEQDIKGGKKPRSGTVRFNLYANRLTREISIGVKIGKGVVKVQGGFTSSKEAREYLAEHLEELEAKLAKMREVPEIRRGNNSPRVGIDHRNGGDVTPEQFADAFGFRGVQFGNYVEGPRRQRDLNEAYDALMDLAGVLDIAPRALSLNGELGLAFGARGKGGKKMAAAHYEPDKVVINLTKGAGAGSLAHEWWHALDNYFATQRRGQNNYTFATDVATSRDAADPMAMRVEMMRAFQRVMNTIKASELPARSKKMDEVRSTPYWSTGIEMSARTFESYVIAKLADQGAANDYLANVVSEASFTGDSYPYPKADELPAVRGALDEFFATIEQEEAADGNVRLYSRPIRSEAVALAELKSGSGDRALSATRVRQIVGMLGASWAGKPRVVVLEEDPGGEAAGAEGWYDAARGEVVLVARNIRGGYDPVLKRRVTAEERVRMVAVHEIVGHAGIEAITGPELWTEIEETVERMRAGGRHADLFTSIDRRYRGANRAIATREAIAVMAEKGISNSVLDRVITALRRFLRERLGLTLRVSEAELRQHIVAAARHMRDGARPRFATAPAALASRADMDPDRKVAVVSLVDGVFGDVERDLKGARARAVAYLRKLRDSGRMLSNEDTGWKIGLSARSIRELVNFDPGKIGMLLALPRITRAAVLVKTVGARSESDSSIRAFHTFYAPVRVNGDLRVARLVVREDTNGTFAYDFQRSAVLERPNPAPGARPAGAGSRQATGLGSPATAAPDPLTDGGAAQRVTGTSMTLAQLRDLVNSVDRPGWSMSRAPGAFYSALAEAVAAGQGAPRKGAAAAWKGWLDGAQRRGEFRQAERDWLGVDAWLDGRETTTREELEAFVRANEVQIEEVMIADDAPNVSDELNTWMGDNVEEAPETADDWTDVADELDDLARDAEGDDRARFRRMAREARTHSGRYDGGRIIGGARYAEYQVPGGENYRELLLTLPNAVQREAARAGGETGVAYWNAVREQQAGTADEYRSTHWNVPNVLAHVRFNERTDVDGKRVLFIEEVQSDWHQDGRKRGYRTSLSADARARIDAAQASFDASAARGENAADWRQRHPEHVAALNEAREAEAWYAVPDAPLKGTDEWALLAFKRMVRHAAENGFDRIAWTTGEQQADRYDLGRRVSEVEYVDGRTLIVRDLRGVVLFNEHTAPEKIADVIGKDPAEKLLAARAARRDGFSIQTITGDGLKVGGDGMRAFYDKILPSAVNKWAKKLGGRVGSTAIPAPVPGFPSFTKDRTQNAHSLDLTDAMREAALGGLPLFSRPEQVTDAIDSVMAGPPAAFFDRARTMFRSLDPKNLRENTRPAWLGALTLRHLAELGKDIKLTQVARYADRVQRMATDRNVMHEDASKVADVWEKFQKRDRGGADATANLMHDTTILGVDPSAEYVPLMTGTTSRGANEPVTAESIDRRKKLVNADMRQATAGPAQERLTQELQELDALWEEERKRRDVYPELVRRYAALPEAGRKLYVEARDAYTRQSDHLLAALEARINALEVDGRQKAAMIAQVRQEFESARIKGPYFPLQRFGEFWISAEDKSGAPLFTMYERVQEWREAQRELAAAGYVVKAAGRKLEDVRSVAGASGGFMSELMNLLDSAGVDQDTRDDAYQLFLRTLPELSVRKHQIHRKATAGYSKDALRAFSSNLFHGSFQIARLRHSHELEADLLSMKKAVSAIAQDDPERAAKAAALYTETGKRHEWVMNPRDSKVASTLTGIGFAWYLGTTPAAALVNLTQTPIVTYPVLAARFGPGKAFTALSEAMGRAMRHVGGDITKGLSEEERAAFKSWQASGAIDKSQAHNLAGLAETDTQSYSGVQRRTMEVVSWLFHNAEVVNREATALAAFRLARQAGQDYHAAVQYAEEVVIESHFDYSNANRARFMQSNAAKVLLLFRQYSLNITWFLWRNLYLSTRGESPEVKKEARAKLAGVLGMTGVFSGLMGMPLMSIMFGVANAAAAAFGDDDDDPFDAEVAFRNMLADLLGADVARILAKGPVDYITGANISGRVSLNDLWLREPNRELEGHAMANYLLEQAAGPLFGGMLVNTLRGLHQIEEGHTWRGVETMMPKAVKDGMKSIRYSTQGVQTLRGDPVIEDLGVGGALLQLAGFSPAKLNERYDGINAAKNFETRLMDRRSSLLNAYAMAWRAGDTEAVQRVMEKIRAFNAAQPTLSIDTATIRQSLQARMRYSSRAEGGVVLNPRVATQAREQARFAE